MNDILDTTEITRAGGALETAERLALMAGEPIPEFVPWGKVYETPEGKFRIRCELRKRRGKDPMITHLDRVK
ncbi:MAG: hypothetical protein SV862_00095 [Pseudomonadota bacterium]|nr:hypothetical protein [Pseudomonadota bacterium]